MLIVCSGDDMIYVCEWESGVVSIMELWTEEIRWMRRIQDTQMELADTARTFRDRGRVYVNTKEVLQVLEGFRSGALKG